MRRPLLNRMAQTENSRFVEISLQHKMADYVWAGSCWPNLGWPNSVLGGPGKIGDGVGLVWAGQICQSLGSSMFGRQVWFEAGAGSTQGRLKVDPRPTNSRFKVEPRRSTQGRPKAIQTSTPIRTQGQRKVDPLPTKVRPK